MGEACVHKESLLNAARKIWALADMWVGYQNDRNDVVGVAVKEWRGPHQETFLSKLEVDYVDEYDLENKLRAAANNWAQAWVDEMNAKSRQLHSDAVDEADSTLEFLPWFSDRPVANFTPIETVPFGPDFEPTGSLYVNVPAGHSSQSW